MCSVGLRDPFTILPPELSATCVLDALPQCSTVAFSGGLGSLRVVSLTRDGASCKTPDHYMKRGDLYTPPEVSQTLES
jgi:hypothetical protein